MCYLGSFSKKKRKRKSAILVVTWNLVYVRYWCTLLKTITWLCCRSNCRDKGIIDEDCKRQIIASHICSNLKRVNCVNCEIRPNRPNGPVGESRTSTSTCPKKVGPILSHGPPVRTKAQTCSSRFKKPVLQAREACPASLRGLFSRSEWLPQQVCEACSTRKGGKTSLL